MANTKVRRDIELYAIDINFLQMSEIVMILDHRDSKEVVYLHVSLSLLLWVFWPSGASLTFFLQIILF